MRAEESLKRVTLIKMLTRQNVFLCNFQVWSRKNVCVEGVAVLLSVFWPMFAGKVDETI